MLPTSMRLLPPLAIATLLAGCAALEPTGSAEGRLVSADAFDRAGAPWAASLGSGCGFCAPGEVDAWRVFVFENGRAALFRWTNDPPPANVTYDRREVDALLADVGEARSAPSVLWTGRLADAGLADELRRAWARSTTTFGCTDFGAGYDVRFANGTVASQDTTCLDRGDPLERFSEPLWALFADLQEVGARQG